MCAHTAWLRCLLATAIIVQPFVAITAQAANPFEAVLDVVHNVKRRAGMNKPKAQHVVSVERVAGEIDWLEHKVETFGTVVPKQPDVWGEARLTKYRREVEKVLENRLEQFDATLQGSIRRSDQSLLTAALTLNAAAGAPSPDGLDAAGITAFEERTAAINEQNAALTALAASALEAGSTDSIQRTAPFTGTSIISPPAEGITAASTLGISIEPTVFNNQLDRYLKALNQLRRINEGDDTSDSPGYSLNLVRIPVSVLPGKLTRKGYGAEVSLTAEPQITDDLLPSTMRSLIVNDVVNMHALPLSQQLLNDSKVNGKFATKMRAVEAPVEEWMRVYDGWLSLWPTAIANNPDFAADLSDRFEFFQRIREYLANRLLQTATVEAGVERYPFELTIPASKLPSDLGLADGSVLTVRASYPSIVQWANRVASNYNDSTESVRRETATAPAQFDCEVVLSRGGTEIAKPIGIMVSLKRPEAYAGELVSLTPPFVYTSPSVEDIKKLLGSDVTTTQQVTTATTNIATADDEIANSFRRFGIDDVLADDIRKIDWSNVEDESLTDERRVLLISNKIQEESDLAKDIPMLSSYIKQAAAKAGPNSLSELLAALKLEDTQADSGQKRSKPQDDKQGEELPSPEAGANPSVPSVEQETDHDFVADVQKAIRSALEQYANALYTGEPSFKLDSYHSQEPLKQPIRLLSDGVSAGALAPQTRVSDRPLPPSMYAQVIGTTDFFRMSVAANASLAITPASDSITGHLDVRQFTTEETNRAYDWLSKTGQEAWGLFATNELAAAVRSRNFTTINRIHRDFDEFANIQTKRSVTATLAWSILVDAALLNERLIDDMRRVSEEKGCPCLSGEHLTFVGPREQLSAEAQSAWKEYVACRWPVQVFALDPVAEEQNIADQFSRRRELQLALAVGVAQGNVRANVASRFARRLETDIETIALNRTAVGFSHGNDTFGWRFHPRLQSPDTPGTLGAMWETLAGGPDPDADLRDRGIEPGIRECTAIVVMPSFIPHVTFDSRASWFSLTNPRRKALTMKDTMKISRNYQAVRRSLNCAHENCSYRPGDVAQLNRVVDQIERRLPLQSMRVPVPFENTLGGFEMFQAGITDLAPELYGWYGAPGVKLNPAPTPKTTTTTTLTSTGSSVETKIEATASERAVETDLFLVGSRFSVHETQVIAGGKKVDHELLSREIMRIKVPGDVGTVKQTLADGQTVKYVDVHVSTPYGVTSHLLVKVLDSPLTVSAAKNTADVTAATKKVEDLEKAVQQMQRNVPEVVASGSTLKLVATRQEDGSLSIKPALGVSSIEVTAENHFGAAIHGIVQFALYDEAKKSYVTKRFSTGLAVDFKGTITGTFPETDRVRLDADMLAENIADAMLGTLTATEFKDSKKELIAVLFLAPNPPSGQDAVIRVLGEVKVEIALTPALTAGSTVSSVERIAAGYTPRRLPVPRTAWRPSTPAAR